MSVASSLLSTRPFHRGWVNQMMSAFGNDSRSAATAGKVWTISPREPRRTTRKRGSVMRRLANGLQQFSCGVILGVTNDRNADAEARGNGALCHGVPPISISFCLNFELYFSQKTFIPCFGQ